MKNEEKKAEEKADTKGENLEREIIITTDGNSIAIKKAEVAGNIELIGILKTIVDSLSKK